MEKFLSKTYDIGDSVKWKWGEGWGRGQIKERFTDKTSITIKGTEVTRDASADNPAYLIEQQDGDQVLKSDSELESD